MDGLDIFPRDVDVIRLICKDSVEVEIMSCAEAKLKLEQDLDNISCKYI